ncbi:MAG: hypothetical protein Q9163_003543 [Psora crenata]
MLRAALSFGWVRISYGGRGGDFLSRIGQTSSSQRSSGRYDNHSVPKAAKKQISLERDLQAKDNRVASPLSSECIDRTKASAVRRSERERAMLNPQVLLTSKQAVTAESFVAGVDKDNARAFALQRPGMSRVQSREQYAKQMPGGLDNKKAGNTKNREFGLISSRTCMRVPLSPRHNHDVTGKGRLRRTSDHVFRSHHRK